MEDATLELHFKTLNEKIDKIDKDNERDHGKFFYKINKLTADVAALKVKSGVWGFIAGAIPASITFVILYIRSQIK